MSEVVLDGEEPSLPGHGEVFCDLGTPRRYTERGGWNICCECGDAFAETGDADRADRWLGHLREVAARPA